MPMKEFTYNSLKSKNGVSIQQKNIQKNFPEDYLKVLNHIEVNKLENIPFSECLFLYFHKYIERPKCKFCKKNTLKFESYNSGYITVYCSHKCMSNDPELNKAKEETRLKKYGVKQIGNSKEIRNKIAKTNLEKYGVDNVFKREDFQNKAKKKILEKYGVSNVLQLSENKTKSKIARSKNPKKNYTKVRSNFKQKYKDVNFTNTIGKNVSFYCNCEKQQKCTLNRSLFRHRYLNEIQLCTNCNPIGIQNSFGEQEVIEYITSILPNNITILKNNRKTIKPLELDLYVPSLKLAVEYDGLFWHREQKVGKNYHLDKTNKCKEQNIRLIHIFEDEWRTKKTLLKSMLNSIFSPKSLKKIYARKCKIVNITKQNAFKYYEENHILGGIYCDVNYGLEIEGEIVAMMGIGKQRRVMGKTAIEDEYELIRFCNKITTNVLGGASKLFTFFIKTHNPKKVLTYANKRFFTGAMYLKLGFQFINDTKPNYYYIKYMSSGEFPMRYHRFIFRKDILIKQGFDKNKTEKEIMTERGFDRIYDCGNHKFIWNKSK